MNTLATIQPLLGAITGEILLKAFIWVVIAAVIFFIGKWALAEIGVQEPFLKVCKVIMVLAVVILLVNALLTIAGRPFIPL